MADRYTGRPDHIEDVLMELHTGHWWGWTDATNKIYGNLFVRKYADQSSANQACWVRWDDLEASKPTKTFLESELVKLQNAWDKLDYSRNRTNDYPDIHDQLDMLYWDKKNNTTTHTDAVEEVKTKWPKDNSGPV